MFYCFKVFCFILLELIGQVIKCIYLVVFYFEQDDVGCDVMNVFYQVKQWYFELEICVLVDWYCVQCGCIGVVVVNINVDWYCEMVEKYLDVCVLVYGVLVNICEVFGVLYLKGFVIDDIVIYSGVSINDVYFY